MSNTPLNADDELRRKISKMCEGIAAGYHGEDGIDYIMQLVLANRRKHDLQAKIDENNRWRTILAPSFDYNTADMEDFNDRVVELKQELEKL